MVGVIVWWRLAGPDSRISWFSPQVCMPSSSSLCATYAHITYPYGHKCLTQSSALTRAFRRVATMPRNVRRFGSSNGDHGGKCSSRIEGALEGGSMGVEFVPSHQTLLFE